MIPDTVFYGIFLVGLCYYLFGVYGPSVRRYRTFRLAQAASRPVDLLLDIATFLTWQVFPLVHQMKPAGSHAVSRRRRTIGNRRGGKRASRPWL